MEVSVEWIQTLANLPPLPDALVKLTLLFALAWGIRPLLRRANSRWRVLAHELGHFVSQDLLWSRLIQILSICLWFHPMVWGVRREHLDACEQVSDAAAAAYVGNAGAYSSVLARIALEVLKQRYALAGLPKYVRAARDFQVSSIPAGR